MNDIIEKIICNSQEFVKLAQEKVNNSLAKTIMLICQDSKYTFDFACLLSSIIMDEAFSGEVKKNDHYIKIMSQSHPDLKIYPTKDKLLVGDSEEIVYESTIKPIYSEKKVFIIKNIEFSTEQAQNKLLKTLEEPQDNVYFILTTSNPHSVLPTIRSRCNKIELGKSDNKTIEEFLGACPNCNLIAALSEGYFGRAEQLKANANLKDLFEGALSLITSLKSSKDLIKYTKQISLFEGKSELFFNFLALIFESMLSLKAGRKIYLKDYQEILTETSEEYSFKALIEATKLLNKAAEKLKYNCIFNVVIENLLLNILEVKYLCK